MITLTDCLLSKPPHWQFLEGLVERRPDISLTEMQVALREVCGIEVSRATGCRTLKRAGFSRKQVRFHVAVIPHWHNASNLYRLQLYRPTPERNEACHTTYKIQISENYEAHQLVFVDESHLSRMTDGMSWNTIVYATLV